MSTKTANIETLKDFHEFLNSKKKGNLQKALGISDERKALLEEWVFCENGLHDSTQGTIAAFTKDVKGVNELAYVMYYFGTLRPEDSEENL